MSRIAFCSCASSVVALARRESGVVDLAPRCRPASSRSMCACVCWPHDGEQPVADFVMVGAVLARRDSREAARIDDLEPVFAARVGHVEREIDPLREAAQDVEVERRRGRQAEDVRRGRQPRARRRVGPHRLHRLEEDHRRMAAVGAEIAGDAPPQRALPALVRRARGVEVRDAGRLAGEPRREPVGAVGQVLLEQRRGARGELVAHHVVGLPQVAGERRMRGDEGAARRRSRARATSAPAR